MGRATYNDFAEPLHQRVNYVLTGSSDPLRNGFQAIGSLDQLVTENPDDEVWVIGGAAVFAGTIADADELLLTQVAGDFDCTRLFPPFQSDLHLGTRSADHQEGGIHCRFETWRINGTR